MKRPHKLVLFFIFILLGLGLGAGYYFLHRPKVSPDRLRMLATWGLADYLAQHFSGEKALVLSNPFTQKKGINRAVIDQETSGIDGLREGFQNKIALANVVYPELKPEAYTDPQSLIANPEVTTPLSFMLQPQALEKVQADNPDCELWISLIGLPVGTPQMPWWNGTNPPHFGLLLPDLRMIGGSNGVRQAILSGKLAAFVTTKPNVTFNTQKMSRDLKREFNQRFVLVHADNLEDMTKAYPLLFRVP